MQPEEPVKLKFSPIIFKIL